MRSLIKRHLQLRIALLTILGLSLALAAFAFLGLRAVEERGRQIRQERLTMARTIAREMDRALEHTRRLVQVTMAREGVHLDDQDLEPEAHALQDAYLLSPLPVYRLLMLDQQGVVRLAVPDGAELVGIDLSSLAVVGRGLESGESQISNLQSLISNLRQPTVLLTVPLTEGWMVVIAVDLLKEGFADFLRFGAPGETGHVQIVDGQGTVLASTLPENVLQPWHHVAALSALQAEGVAAVGLYPAVKAGQPMRHDLVAFAPLPHTPWGVAVEQEEWEAMAPARRLQREFLWLGLAVLAVALLLVWGTTRQMLRPVQVLTAQARRLAAGELDGTVPPMGEDEIGQLARAFESMRAGLSASRHETEFLLGGLHRASEEADRLAARLSAQYAIAAVLSRSLSLDELYRAFAAELRDLIPFDRMSVAVVAAESTLSEAEGALEGSNTGAPTPVSPGTATTQGISPDGSGEMLIVSAATGLGQETLPRGMVVRADEGAAGWVMRHRRPFICADMEGDNRYPAHERLRQLGLRSYVVLPLLVRQQSLGTLNLGSRQPNAYAEEDLPFLESVAGQLAVAMENARLYEETQLQAITDPLTRLYNRRRFEARLAEEIGRARRYHHPLSMLMADIDYFKRYNDTYGHPQGDVVLQGLARLLRANVRETDFVARYGGEEFAVLLPETTKAGAMAVAEKIRAAVTDYPFPFEETQPQGKLTISLGVATFPDDLAEPAELVRKADQSLYRAKGEGRDRVCGAWE